MHRMRRTEDGDLLSLPSAPDDLRASSVNSQSASSDLSSSSSSSSFYSPSSFVPANLTDKVSSMFSLTAPLSASSSSSMSSSSSRFTGSPSPISDEAELLDGELDELQHAAEWSATPPAACGEAAGSHYDTAAGAEAGGRHTVLVILVFSRINSSSGSGSGDHSRISYTII